MAILRADPVGIYHVRFLGIKPTKNPDYYTLLLRFEYSLEVDGIEMPAEGHLQPATTSHLVATMKAGRSYYLRMAARCSAGRGDYPPRLTLTILDVICECPNPGKIEYLLAKDTETNMVAV